jgi:exosortase/archaeosortase family protein
VSSQVATLQRQAQTTLSTALRRQGQARAFWEDSSPRARTTVQMTALLVTVGVAYNYSLTTLWQLADLNSPLAYVGLVPLISLLLAAVHRHPRKPEPAIHDRQTDYIIGIPLMGIALLVNALLPAKLSAMFWVWRIDLLTMPLFVAGAVAVIFGVRVLWRQKLAVGFLFLAWTFPYTSVLLGLLNAFTSATAFFIAHLLSAFHIAKPVPGLANAVFSVVHNGHPFNLSVVSVCSGVNSVVGFLLVGSAFAGIVRGPLVRKLGWLLCGMVLLWTINLVRILVIFWTGQHFGENLAINILHPYIGLFTFTAGVGIMILCMKPFGLRIPFTLAEPGPISLPADGHSPPDRTTPNAVPKVYAAIAVVLAASILVGLSNADLKSYNLVANVAGQSKLVSLIVAPVTPAGWTSRFAARFNWAEPLFGEDSTWNRYDLYPVGGGDLRAQTDVVADVIDTPDLQAFSAFGIEQCYEFHGYSLADVSQVTLGGGVTGQSLAYTSSQYGSWSIVYWILPVNSGSKTDYERVVLYVRNQKGLVAPATKGEQPDIKNLAGNLSVNDPNERVLLQNRAYLVAYAQQLIRVQAGHSAQSVAQRTSA